LLAKPKLSRQLKSSVPLSETLTESAKKHSAEILSEFIIWFSTNKCLHSDKIGTILARATTQKENL